MKKIIKNTLIVLYAVIAIFATICLLSYNDFRVTEFGDYSLVIIKNRELEPKFEKGDLVITDKTEKIEVGDTILFYNTYEKDIVVVAQKVINIEEITATEKTYTLENEKEISSEYVLGSIEEPMKISKAGTILNILESKWGFLLLIVLPSLIAFIYEIGEVISEIRNDSDKKEKNKESK